MPEKLSTQTREAVTGGSRILLINNITMEEIDYRAAVLLECVGEPIRFQIIRHLQSGPRPVYELTRLTKRHQATICRHLAVLRNLQVVRYRNHGSATFYEIKLKGISRLLDLAVRCVRNTTPTS